jgi:nickel/cobalt transporter (NicO) family protein
MQYRRILIVVGALIAAFLAATPAEAHPMGNFSVNHYSAITVQGDYVQILYLVDMAEIPTFQELTALGVDHGSALTGPQRAAYLHRKARKLLRGLRLSASGAPLKLTLRATGLLFPPGAGGLPTERVYLALGARVPSGTRILYYVDRTFEGHTGWEEIVANGAGVRDASVPSSSRTGALTVYPTTVTSSPPQDLDARIEIGPSSSGTFTPPGELIHRAEAPLLGPHGGWSSLSRGLARKGPNSPAAFSATRIDALSNLIGQQDLSLGVLALSLVLAFWFGAGHALSPGHGKTVVAAYLVGNRGTAWHATLLGLTVTVTHTAGVFALGLVTLYLSSFILPDQLFPWLGFISGMLVAVMGLTLFIRRSLALRGRKPKRWSTASASRLSVPLTRERLGSLQSGRTMALTDHPASGVPHRHGPFGKSHTHAMPEQINIRNLIGLGISGGLLPCPSALIVLLSAIAFHRVAFGMLLIVAFSLGLATTLTTIGLLVVYSGRVLSRMRTRSGDTMLLRTQRVVRVLPVFSALVVAALGTFIAIGAVSPSHLPALIIHL